MREARTHPGHLWDKRYQTISLMHTAGVKLVVSSDQGSTGTRIDELPLLMEFLTQTVRMPAVDVLCGVTGLAAEALGLEQELGTLTPGKLADMVVVDGDPLADMAIMQRVHTVIKDGEVMVRDGGVVWPATAAWELTRLQALASGEWLVVSG
jgi:imidazolonepropionase-like amidohydrolase